MGAQKENPQPNLKEKKSPFKGGGETVFFTGKKHG